MALRSGLLAAALIVLVGGCGSSDDDTAVEAAASTPLETAVGAPTVPTPPVVEPATVTPEPTAPSAPTATEPPGPEPGEDAAPRPLLAAEGTRTTWSGTIDGDIGFTMWLAQQDRFVRGEITYDAIGEPITVVGMTNPGWDFYVLREFGPDGRVSGTMTFEYDGQQVITDGLWVDLPLVAEYDGVDELPYHFDPLVRPGRYGYSFPPFGEGGDPCCGPVGTLVLSDIGPDSITIAFENNRGGPSFNQAVLDPTVVPLTGNRAVFDGVREELQPDCAFEIVVFDGFAFVTHLEDRFDCGFGNAAGIEGTYLLIE